MWNPVRSNKFGLKSHVLALSSYRIIAHKAFKPVLIGFQRALDRRYCLMSLQLTLV